MKRLGGLLLSLVVVAGLVAFLVLMGSLIYPGALKWTGGSVCPADQQDTVVVRDTYQTEPGETSTNFTLYCVGPRGAFTDAGFAKPLSLLIAGAVVAAWAVLFVLWLIRAVHRRVGRGDGRDEGVADGTAVVPAQPVEDFGGQPPVIT